MQLCQVDQRVDGAAAQVQGIYRPRPHAERLTVSGRLGRHAAEPGIDAVAPKGVLHPKYQLPARCFGYVGDPGDPRTWKLP